MKVLRRYKDEETWTEISLDEALSHLEGAWKEGTIIPMLKEGEVLWSPWAYFKKKNGEK